MYVIISSSIFSNPYWFGNPFVVGTVMVVAAVSILEDNVVEPTTTSGVRLSTLRYWSKFSTISVGPPWYSCEI